MIRIDGSYLEGGGQILRTSLSLSALLGREFAIGKIRANRKKPGLQPQHLTAVGAVKEICGAEAEGAELHSTELRFKPGKIRGDKYIFDVSEVKESAGAVSLVLQAVLPPLMFAPESSHLTLRGGTHVNWSPCFEYINEIFLPAVRRMGAHAECRINKYGWYPLGKGEIEAVIGAGKSLKGISIAQRGKLRNLEGVSVVSNLPDEIARRQKDEALVRLAGIDCDKKIGILNAPSAGKGTLLFLKAQYENAAAGFFSLGELGKAAERVAREAVEKMLQFQGSGSAAVDEHLADQLLMYAALAEGKTEFCAQKISSHLLTNAYAIKQFIPDVKIGIEAQAGKVEIEGIGFGGGKGEL